MNSADFYDWQRAASSNGVLWRAVSEYYAGSEYQYRIRVDDVDYDLPVLVAPHWLDRRDDVDSVFGEYDSEQYLDAADMDDVRSRVQRIAYWNTGETVDDPDIDDYIWNAEIVHPRLTMDALEIETGRTTYFSSLTQDERLSTELAEGLYEAGLPADASPDRTRAAVDDIDLPERDTVAPTLPEFVDNMDVIAAPFGVNTATVFNTGDGYELVMSQRGESVAVHPAKLSLIPAGGIELAHYDEPSARWTALHEYGEELFSISEETNVLDHEPVADLEDLLATGGAHLDFLGLSLAASRLGVNIMTVLVVDDPAYYDKHIADGIDFNWENEGGMQIPLDDEQALTTHLTPEDCVPPHVACAYEALMHLDTAYDISTPLSLTRLNPQ